MFAWTGVTCEYWVLEGYSRVRDARAKGNFEI